MKSVALPFAFLLELIAFGAFACFGLLFHIGTVLHVLIGISALSALITFWSVYMAPRAPKKLNSLPYYVAKTFLYAVAALVIFVKLRAAYGILFVVFALLDEILLFRHNLEKIATK